MNRHYECSGRDVNGNQDPWGCRRAAVSGFMAASGTEQRKAWLFCGVEHTHPSVKPLDDLIKQLLGEPREVGEPFPTSVDASTCPRKKRPTIAAGRKVDERAMLALAYMRNSGSLHDWHVTSWLGQAMGVDTPSARSAALKALHDQSLIEPGKRSMWRLTAKGRNMGEPYQKFI